ncbi:benzoate--CoA ligase [Actibacterium mucosum KCTC 23349]|uniref:Benzoate--CoA ligase n=1 Tax=Actibacterium mucosum KCTC 23349 TaxID=1454373 RepID=A0A037ZK41_9RHOB|nr:class I adenylate-forming enzyme family protein [Actibacterium mucosum]KAJ56805.1 benzoate--CoA ligase [Actibacterium mucosum KCTC 23349]
MTDPCPTPFNMAQYVLGQAGAQPDKLALAIVTPTGAERWRYGALRDAVLGAATTLTEHGVKPGDRVMLRLGNSVEFPIAFLAAITIGALPVPTSAMLTTAEVTKMAVQVEPALVIAAAGIDLPDGDTPVMRVEALRDGFTNTPATFELGDPNRPAYLIFTSGTGGTPRGVLHAHRAVWARRMMWTGWYGLTMADRLLHAGAFNWTYTLGTGLMDPWAIGATALIPGPDVTATQLPLLLKRYDATIFAAAPGVYRQVLKTPVPPLPRLRHGLSAGEKLPPGVADQWAEATGTKIYEALGMSECSTFVSSSPSRPAPEGSSGYAQPGRVIAALDSALKPVAADEAGQLAIRRDDPGLMLRYWNAPEATEEKFQGNWFLTGDMVSIAQDGAVTYQGRNDDLLNAGGFRVSPMDVEAALGTHPNIAVCAAVDIEVKPGATVIALFYEGVETAEDTLKSFAEPLLAKYKQPRLYRHVATLPKGGNGKLSRKKLREEWTAS